MWKLLLVGERAWPLVDDWCEFLTASHSGRAVSKDTWAQLLDFIQVRGEGQGGGKESGGRGEESSGRGWESVVCVCGGEPGERGGAGEWVL